ncbi:hypothetical protein KR032_009491 [Drosophila birchii]|nr:hypothetical protein KR032_009491 [Drosophila birchii]
MSSQCRICGKEIQSNNAIDIFEGNNVIINQIALVTGVQLTDQLDFPKSMCFSCLASLNEAIHFRELCVATNQRLTLETLDSETEDFNEPLDSTEELALERDVAKMENIEDDVEIEIIKQIREIIEEDEADYYNSDLQKQMRLKDPEKGILSTQFYDINHNYVDTINRETTGTTSHGTQPVPQEITQKMVRKKIYFCDQCGKEFNDKSNLNLHLVRHKDVKPFECPDCGKREFNMYLMNIHIRVKHHGEKPFACKYCDERFVDSTKRCRHQSRMHELKATNRRYKCAFCDLRFEVQSELKKHKVVHSGERKYPCEICNVSFTRNFNLKTHFRSRLHKKNAEESQKEV